MEKYPGWGKRVGNTMMTDPISDMLTRIRNALMMKQEQAVIPYSKLKEQVARLLAEAGYIQSVEVAGEGTQKALICQLKYLPEGTSAITGIARISKPSRRVYRGYEDLKGFRGGLGLQILSTSKGVLTDVQAREQKIGGEVLLEIY